MIRSRDNWCGGGTKVLRRGALLIITLAACVLLLGCSRQNPQGDGKPAAQRENQPAAPGPALVQAVQPQSSPQKSSVVPQEQGKPKEQAVRYLVEVGPDRADKTNQFVTHIWGRRTTYSDNRVEYSIRIVVGNSAAVLHADSMSDFVSFAKQVEEKKKDLQAQKPALESVIRWEVKDVDGRVFSLACSMPNGRWTYDIAELHGFVPSLEMALKDIEGIKANKAKVPW